MADWAQLPDLLLGHIFSYLSTPTKLCLSEVCPQWATAVCRPEVWQTFSFYEDSFLGSLLDFATIVLHGEGRDQQIDEETRHKYLAIIRTVGKYFRSVKLYYSSSKEQNSVEVINCLAENCHGLKQLKVVKLHSFVNVVKNHENPCKKAVYRLIKQNIGLQVLNVKDLDTYDSTVTQRQDILPLGAGHSQHLRKLYFLQSFQGNNLSNLMYLVNLKVLAIEPKVLTYSLLYHLAGKALTDLHIVALSKHTQFYNEALQNWQWKKICLQSPQFRVHCHFGVGHEWTEKEVMLKKDMPVVAFKYQKDHLLHYSQLSLLLINYSATLEVFIDLSFSLKVYEIAQNDCNAHSIPAINVQILNFVRACPKLRILIVKEVLWSSTILAMLAYNSNLEIILMEDQVKYDYEKVLLRETNIVPALTADVIEVIHQGHTGDDSFRSTVDILGATRLKILHKAGFIALMLEKYVNFTY